MCAFAAQRTDIEGVRLQGYLEGRIGEEVEAAVLETSPRRTLAVMLPYLQFVSLAPREHHELGARVMVRLLAVMPRAGRVRVEEVG